ncbi:substrate-binding periplasmic protein [Chitinilyticum piscinae]|nr:transporter substrate-binding domain-containing protein [Chitinilyticum piscinae]
MLLALLLSPLAMAGPVNCPEQPIRLAYYEYGLLYDSGRGIDKDVAEELMRRSGCRFSTSVLPRARIWADLASGELDMSMSGIQTAERDRFAWFAPYLAMKNYALLNKSAAAKISKADDFLANPDLQFGVVRAFRHGKQQDEWLAQLRQQQRIQESPDAETLYQKLKQGRVSAIFSQPPVFAKYLQKLGMQSSILIEDWTPGERGVPHGLILAKQRFSQEDAQRWQVLVRQLRDDGTLRTIFLRHLGPAEAQTLLDF